MLIESILKFLFIEPFSKRKSKKSDSIDVEKEANVVAHWSIGVFIILFALLIRFAIGTSPHSGNYYYCCYSVFQNDSISLVRTKQNSSLWRFRSSTSLDGIDVASRHVSLVSTNKIQ
jgi:hypothetical protein